VFVGIVQVVGTYFAGRHQLGHRSLDAIAFLLLAAGPAALFWLRRYPVPVLAVVFATTFAYTLADYPRGPIFFALVIAVFYNLLTGHRVAAATVVAGGYVAILWVPPLVSDVPLPSLAEAVGVAAWLAVIFTVAELARGRRAQAMEAARVRAEESRRQASEERLRIARELHDVLAHNISLINVQAGVALHLMDAQPEQARTALSAIKDASNEALAELRSVLDILRHSNESAPRTPARGLENLDELVTRSGLDVATQVRGTPRSLPPGVDLAAFRIVQEALTNVTRHAGPARVEVTLDFGEDDLRVVVEDDGEGTADRTVGTGSGIGGMRDRAAAVGGRLEAGPRPGGGWRVVARLPLDPAHREVAP
jgi:signal transduction histidine kinase